MQGAILRMLNLEKSIRYTINEATMLSELDLTQGKGWEKQTNKMKKLKKRLRKRLFVLQKGRCVYCGNSLFVTSALEIEHIAPKGKELYPEFTFNCRNLVAACSFCNGCYKKHDKDIISKHDANYEECEFKIVHPYLDNPDEHIYWVDEKKVLINSASSSDKGKFTISLFGLEDSVQTLQRAKDYQLRKKLEGTPYEGKILSNEDIANILNDLT